MFRLIRILLLKKWTANREEKINKYASNGVSGVSDGVSDISDSGWC